MNQVFKACQITIQSTILLQKEVSDLHAANEKKKKKKKKKKKRQKQARSKKQTLAEEGLLV